MNWTRVLIITATILLLSAVIQWTSSIFVIPTSLIISASIGIGLATGLIINVILYQE